MSMSWSHSGRSTSALVALWRETRLSAGAVIERGPSSSGTGLLQMVQAVVGQATPDRRTGHVRIVPSAGGIYPFSVISIAVGNELRGIYEVDSEQAAPHSLGTGLDLATLASALSPCTAPLLVQGSTVLLIVVHPWRSMRKYGERGFFYSLLDAGHLTAALAGALRLRGLHAVVDLHFDRARLGIALGLDAACRECVAALIVPACDGMAAAASCERAKPSAIEHAMWHKLVDAGLVGIAASPSTLDAIAAPNDVGTYAAHLGPALGGELAAYAARRRSACAFTNKLLAPADIEQLLAAARLQCRQTRSKRAASLRARIVVKSGDGRGRIYDLVDDGLSEASGKEASTEGWAEACMKQRFIDGAAALLVLYSPDFDWRADDAPGHLSRLHLYAGQWMHLVYLSAAKMNVGITALGGFDDQLCKRLAQLNASTDLLYAAALGEEDPFGQKSDRASVAFSHGLSARLEPVRLDHTSGDYAAC
jgi:hypothetical protein